MSGAVSKVVVKLKGLKHTYPDDLDILLVGPVGSGGKKVMLMSDAGGGGDLVNVTLTFDDAAATALPNSTQIVSGTYLPTNYPAPDGSTVDPFVGATAPAAPYGTILSTFNGTSPNGAWQLFVVDDAALDQGAMAGGWELIITTNQ